MEPYEITVKWINGTVSVVQFYKHSEREIVLCSCSEEWVAERIAASLRLTAHLATEWIPKATVSVEK